MVVAIGGATFKGLLWLGVVGLGLVPGFVFLFICSGGSCCFGVTTVTFRDLSIIDDSGGLRQWHNVVLYLTDVGSDVVVEEWLAVSLGCFVLFSFFTFNL